MSAPVKEASAEGIRWNLDFLFSSIDDPKIKESWDKANQAADQFAQQYRGKVAELSAPQLAQAIKELEKLAMDSTKPVHYASLRFAADTSDPKLGGFLQDQSELSSEIRVKLMFFDLELQKIPGETIEQHLKDPSLQEYGHFIKNVRIYTPYMLSETEEALLEQTANVGSRAWVRLHDEITSNYMFSYTAPGSDKVEKLNQGLVLEKLRDPNRAVRQAAADAFSAGLDDLNRVICFTYNTLLADKKLEDKLRKMEFAEQSRHLANELDKSTVDIVMELCKQRSDLVERYYKVKKEILGLERLTHIDRYAPLFETKATISWDEAKKRVLESFGAFSPVMEAKAAEHFEKNWIDAEARDGKTGGAFCNYVTPDTHPVMLMTYLGNLNDVMTLAHELGHCVHGSLSRKQSFFNFDGSLPLAELASIFGEMLVFENVVKDASTEDKLALYADKIEGIFASVHRQASMFRFEQKCHTHRREKGELTPEEFGAYWQEEIGQMFGDSITLEEQHANWWSYVGHFFFAPFYVYAYSFGELLTLSIYQMAQKSPDGFAEKYVEVLELGGSETPQELMAHLGVDLTSKAFWEGGFEALDSILTRFENLWKEYSANN